MDKNLNRILVFLIFLTTTAAVHAQVSGLPYELKKPQKFENRKLASEKTGDKKFTVPRKFMQSMITHYNYYFNANEKINQVIARAKDGHRDDYTRLLSFYNYSLEETARFKGDLDSVIYKSTAGILLHDLRNSWIDNLYLLIGRAYFLRNTLDSAYYTFQYVNFAFSPKEADGYDKVIGSNSNEGALSVSTSEKANIVKKALSRPPSRNEALVWQVKTYLAADDLTAAASLIQTLKQDPQFPPRLKTDLREVQALYFYKQGMYDSAARYLEQALPNAANSQEEARWEYLIAQLYEKSGRKTAAEEFYLKAQRKTIDPIMEVYALLNSIRQEQGNEDKSIQKAVDQLVKMAHRDKYVDYRDIIYYTAAIMESDRKNIAGAKLYLGRSIKYSTNNPQQKSKSFLALADLSFAQKDFVSARRFYDSVQANTIDPADMAAFKARKQALTDITRQMEIIDRQDSLQRLAALPLAEREAYVKKLARRLRREQGLKDEDVSFGNTGNNPFTSSNNNAPTDLFGSSSAATDWYFTNDAVKSKGYTDFKTRWGNRPNVDNWQRSAAVQNQLPGNKSPIDQQGQNALPVASVSEALSYESLLKNIPVAPEKLKISNDSVMKAMYTEGKALQDGLEDYPAAIDVYEKLLERFPSSPMEEQTLFNLYYCYRQTGNQQKMEAMKSRLGKDFANGKLAARVNNPELAADSLHKKSSEQSYDQIYNLFIEGKFDEALARKHDADSLYGNHYWTPQLLYIEAVYHIQQRDDSTAIKSLNHIVSLYPGSPMADRAKKLVEVLGRRRQIEDYLTNLKIERSPEDSTALTIANAPTRQQVGTPLRQDSATVGTVKPAVTYIPPPKADSLKAVNKPVAPALPSSFVYAPEKPHYVALVMDKVDPVYVNEAKNAFTRYHKEKYPDKNIGIVPMPLTDDIRFVLFGTFDNAATALDYIEKTRKLAATDIIPWMPAAKYSFILVSELNLDVLKNNKDLQQYMKFLAQHLPDYFK